MMEVMWGIFGAGASVGPESVSEMAVKGSPRTGLRALDIRPDGHLVYKGGPTELVSLDPAPLGVWLKITVTSRAVHWERADPVVGT